MEEKKIVLTAEEKEVIRQQLNGEFGAFTATPTQQQLIMGVTDKAESLLDELDAYDELDGDLIQWYWDKYKAQEGIVE